MASKGQWKGKGVLSGAHLAKSQNQPSKGARKGKGGSLSKSQDQAAKEAPGKGKGKGVARGDSVNDDDEPRIDHDHSKCITEREYLAWGTPSDSDSDTPLSPSLADVLFPIVSPELKARLDEAEELEACNARTLHRIELQKLFDALDALEARELSSSAPQDSVKTTE